MSLNKIQGKAVSPTGTFGCQNSARALKKYDGVPPSTGVTKNACIKLTNSTIKYYITKYIYSSNNIPKKSKSTPSVNISRFNSNISQLDRKFAFTNKSIRNAPQGKECT